MKIEIKLRQILQDHRLDNPGIITTIAKDTGCHRNTIAKLYHNQSQNPPLDVLGLVCDWLRRKGVKSGLPGVLFGKSKSKLWEAVASPREVTLYLGEQIQPELNISWISRRDASVQTEIMTHLSRKAKLFTTYVPFRAVFGGDSATKNVSADHQGTARKVFEQMRADLPRTSAVLIGSQRVNYLLEYLVADLFGCSPFVSDRSRIQVPFHLAFGTQIRDIESCFGGLRAPPCEQGAFNEGIYYLNSERKWICCPSVKGKVDSGIVITCYEPGADGIQLAIAGISGRATEALGRSLTQTATEFWPPYVDLKGRKLGIYVCHFDFVQESSSDPNAEVRARDMEVTPISAEVLQEYLV